MPWRPWEDVLALVELAAPSACAGCGRAGLRWCPACQAVLGEVSAGPWRPTPCPPGLPRTWSGAPYDGVVRSAVVAWKDGGRADLTGTVLAPVLRDVLAAALAGSPPHRAALAARTPVLLVPAPSARASTRRRGEHRVLSLVTAAVGRGAARAGPARPALRVVDALELSRGVADQSGLGAAQRHANLAGAVRARPTAAPVLASVPCVVVDDVVTTGATLAECARALRAARSGPVVAVTIAATRRRTGRSGSSGRAAVGPLPVPGTAD